MQSAVDCAIDVVRPRRRLVGGPRRRSIDVIDADAAVRVMMIELWLLFEIVMSDFCQVLMSEFLMSVVGVDQNDYPGDKTKTKYIGLSGGPLGCENMYWLYDWKHGIDIDLVGRAVGGSTIVIGFGVGFHDLLWNNEC